MVKPCYRRENDVYLLAHLSREGDQYLQPCKALISPGNCSPVTRATGEFLRRCGWLASTAAPAEQDSELGTADRADSSRGAAQVVHCKLVVGNCQLSTVLEVVEHVEFADDSVLSRWQIHIGGHDFEEMQRNAWDIDICYLDVHPEIGQVGDPPECPLKWPWHKCKSPTAALKHDHRECLSYWHMDAVTHHHKGHDLQSSQLVCCDAIQMSSAEALLYVHDVLGVPWYDYTCSAAARCDSLECLSYAHVSGCAWDSAILQDAAEKGSLRCMAYAHEHGCEWSRLVLHTAASRGHLECLKYAHTHGCPYRAHRPYYFHPCSTSWLTTDAVYASSMSCLAYVHEVMGCVWDPEGGECKVAFQKCHLELLQYIHSHGGVLCKRFELLCPDIEEWLNRGVIKAERKALCLLYVHCYGGCRVKGIWHTWVGELARELIKARRVAVLLSFNAAGKACVGDPVIAAAHAAMQRMPSDIVQEIICTAGLQVV